jgi:hypothetical protein
VIYLGEQAHLCTNFSIVQPLENLVRDWVHLNFVEGCPCGVEVLQIIFGGRASCNGEDEC